MREAGRGLVAAAAAVLAMTVVAAAGLALLGAGRAGDLGALTAAAVALAAGGTAVVDAVPAAGLPIAVRGSLYVLPLGVSVAGAVVLGRLLLRGRADGLLVRGAAAAVALPAALGVFAWAARGKLSLPDGVATGGCARSGGSPRLPVTGALDAGFSVAAGPAVVGALAGTLVVAGACWTGRRFPVLARSLRVMGRVAGAIAALGLAAAWTFGGTPAAGAVLLVLPQLVSGVLLLGLGVPWTVSATACVPDLSPGGPASWVAAAVLLACGVAIRSRRPGTPLRRAAVSAARLAPAAGAVLAVVTLLSRASVDVAVRAFGFSLPVFDARLGANPLLALAAGLAGGAVAGFAGSLLADAISVSSRAWKR